MWGIGVSACDMRDSSPDSCCGQNLLGQALELAQAILLYDTTSQGSSPVTHLRLDMTPITANAYTPKLSVFNDSMPDDDGPVVLSAHD